MVQRFWAGKPVNSLLLISVLFVTAIVCCRMFEFSQPLLNYLFVVMVLLLPVFAISPLRRLSKLPKTIGLTLLSPLLFLELLYMISFAACDSPELHHYRPDSCIQEAQRIQQDDYSVHLFIDCGGGATIRNSEWIEQRMQLVPGLYLVRTIDSFYGAAAGEMRFSEPNVLLYRRHEGNTAEGVQDHTYSLKHHVYF